MLHYIGCRLSTSRLRIGFASTPSPFRLTHQSTHTRLYFLLFALASRHYMEADLLFSGVQYSTYLHTHLDITSHLRMHPSSISSNLPFIFVFVVWDGMVWGVRARQGQRQAYWSRAGCIFGVQHYVTSHPFPFSVFFSHISCYLFANNLLYYVGVEFGLILCGGEVTDIPLVFSRAVRFVVFLMFEWRDLRAFLERECFLEYRWAGDLQNGVFGIRSETKQGNMKKKDGGRRIYTQ